MGARVAPQNTRSLTITTQVARSPASDVSTIGAERGWQRPAGAVPLEREGSRMFAEPCSGRSGQRFGARATRGARAEPTPDRFVEGHLSGLQEGSRRGGTCAFSDRRIPQAAAAARSRCDRRRSGQQRLDPGPCWKDYRRRTRRGASVKWTWPRERDAALLRYLPATSVSPRSATTSRPRPGQDGSAAAIRSPLQGDAEARRRDGNDSVPRRQ